MNIIAILCFGLSIISFTAGAQKLPNLQESNFRAPVDVKIDGMATEWGNKFQAYNHATDVLYTIANDDENLYLVIQTNDRNNIFRIFGRGITWTIQQGDSKDDKNKISVTYPIIQNGLSLPYEHKKKGEIGDTTSKAADSLMKRSNKAIADSCKLIGVNGIPGVDTLISIYSHDGIRARGRFDAMKNYTCEFSIKLKFLKIPANTVTKLTYRISINGIKEGAIKITPAPNLTSRQEATVERMNQFFNQQAMPTYLVGEYILAKK